MHRTQTVVLGFALAAALATIISAALAYEGLRVAFEQEFESRLAKVADIAASEVSPEDAADVRRLGAESGGFFALLLRMRPPPGGNLTSEPSGKANPLTTL